MNRDHPSDLRFPSDADAIAALNPTFRTLYAENRKELFASTPLSAFTLIGTGEIWRVEYGRIVKSYPPTPWLVHVKGLMHAVIGVQATWAMLLRRKDRENLREGVQRLTNALQEAIVRVPADLPPKLLSPALAVLNELIRLSIAWLESVTATPEDFPLAFKRLHPQLAQIIEIVGEEVYVSVSKELHALFEESAPLLRQNCLVCVCGVAFGRRDNVEIAAAMSLMGREALGTRLLHRENAHTIDEGLSCLAAALADRELGIAVFDDAYRMWRDILGDVAVRHAGGGFFPGLGKEELP